MKYFIFNYEVISKKKTPVRSFTIKIFLLKFVAWNNNPITSSIYNKVAGEAVGETFWVTSSDGK